MSRLEGLDERFVRGKRGLVDVAAMMAENSLNASPSPRDRSDWKPPRRQRRRRTFAGTPVLRRIKI